MSGDAVLGKPVHVFGDVTPFFLSVEVILDLEEPHCKWS